MEFKFVLNMENYKTMIELSLTIENNNEKTIKVSN